jgi:hypothetical protein
VARAQVEAHGVGIQHLRRVGCVVGHGWTGAPSPSRWQHA